MQRHLRAAAFAATLFLPLALMSCDGQVATEPQMDLDAARAQPSQAVAGHIVNGKATLWVPEPWNGWMNLPFHARLKPDGSVVGRWQHQLRGNVGGGRVIVEVECMSVQGNRAWLGGRSTYAGNPGNIGKSFGLYLIDNGEGKNSPPDQMTRTLWFGPDVQRMWDHCADMPTDYDIWPLAGGNVQIR